MRIVIQRVSHASVTIEGHCKSSIGKGMLILVGIEESDGQEDIDWLCKKIVNLRIFDDENGVMNKSILEDGGEILVISQFTLHASTKKGNRPSYIKAPAFSACMVDGKRAYELARKGEEVELKAKQLVIDEIELLECRLDDPEPMIQIRVVCSKGTYIRALARDIGEALHSGAHLTGLIRTRVGDVRLEDCLNPEHFKEWIDGQEIENEEENN